MCPTFFRVFQFVLVNNGTEADLADGVAWLWDNRLAPLRRLGAAGRPA